MDERTVAVANIMKGKETEDADARAACALVLNFDGNFSGFWPRVITGDTNFLAEIPSAAVARKAARTETGKAASVSEVPHLTDACHLMLVTGALAVQNLYELSQRE